MCSVELVSTVILSYSCNRTFSIVACTSSVKSHQAEFWSANAIDKLRIGSIRANLALPLRAKDAMQSIMVPFLRFLSIFSHEFMIHEAFVCGYIGSCGVSRD